jgi:hypothetical protein
MGRCQRVAYHKRPALADGFAAMPSISSAASGTAAGAWS